MSLLFGGCVVATIVTAPISLAVATVSVAGKAVGTVASATGKAVSSAFSSGDPAPDSVEGLAKLSRPGEVTFVAMPGGAVVRVPWQDGLTLAGASGLAKVPALQESVTVLHAGKFTYAAAHDPDGTVPLAAGDVVRLAK